MMNLRCFLCAFIVCMSMAALCSCEHRILTDPIDVHYVRVYLDEEIKNVNCGFYNESYEHPEFTRPMNMLACLADVQTGEIMHEGILRNQGTDERGNYIDGYIGAPLGEYNLLIYQLGSPLTLIKNTDDYFNIQAYTYVVSDRVLGYLEQTSKVIESGRIVQEPEHILVARCKDIHVKQSWSIDTDRKSVV